MMRQRVGSKRCRLPLTHTYTHIHACRRAELSQVLYCITVASLYQRESERDRTERAREREEFVVTALVDSAF